MNALAFVRKNDHRIFALHPSAMQATYVKREVDPTCIVDGVAVVCIDGPLDHKPGFWFDDYESILQRYRDAIYHDEVRVVLLKIDSPGGDAAGLNETANAMIRCKEETGKMVCAFADEGAYSAAYALACVADEIYLPEPGGVGSVGVISALTSYTRMYDKAGVDVELIMSGARKADGNPDGPITEEARAHVQRRVNGLAEIYWRLVAKSRGMTLASVKAMQADTYYGENAVQVGVADAIMTLDDVLLYARGAAARM